VIVPFDTATAIPLEGSAPSLPLPGVILIRATLRGGGGGVVGAGVWEDGDAGAEGAEGAEADEDDGCDGCADAGGAVRPPGAGDDPESAEG
jgi:hypothetical protein